MPKAIAPELISTHSSLYETHFYAWVQEQAKLLKLGKLNALDLKNLNLKNLIEEIESLGKQQKQKLISAWLSNWGKRRIRTNQHAR